MKQLQIGFGIVQGEYPVYVTIGADKITPHAVLSYAGAEHFGNGASTNRGWGGVKVIWIINPSYTGPLLIRGRQLDGSHEVRFNGLDQKLLFDALVVGAPWPNVTGAP